MTEFRITQFDDIFKSGKSFSGPFIERSTFCPDFHNSEEEVNSEKLSRNQFDGISFILRNLSFRRRFLFSNFQVDTFRENFKSLLDLLRILWICFHYFVQLFDEPGAPPLTVGLNQVDDFPFKKVLSFQRRKLFSGKPISRNSICFTDFVFCRRRSVSTLCAELIILGRIYLSYKISFGAGIFWSVSTLSAESDQPTFSTFDLTPHFIHHTTQNHYACGFKEIHDQS